MSLDPIRAEIQALPLPDVPARDILCALLVAQRVFDDVSVQSVGRRLEDHLELSPDLLWKRWGEPDLLPLLDLLASAIKNDEHISVLFDDISDACAALGWFALDRVIPKQTAFDANLHRAIDRVVHDEFAGRIVELVRPGRRTVRGALLEPSHVIIAVGGAS